MNGVMYHFHELENSKLFRCQLSPNWPVKFITNLNKNKGIFGEIDKLFLKFTRKCKRPRMPK